jgi:hypothetical protein
LDVNEGIVDCIIGHVVVKKGKRSHQFRLQFMDGSVCLVPRSVGHVFTTKSRNLAYPTNVRQ